MARLSNKTALITGGTTGIGLETAMRFIAEGARVAITGTNPDNLETARQALGPDALVIAADAGSVDAQKDIAAQVAAAFGKLDILFVNAGIAQMKPLADWTEADYDRSFAVNLKGPFFLAQALLPILADPASIILNGSINAHIGMPQSAVYAATKAGLISLARTLSGELIGRGIRVNVISPGPVSTPLYEKVVPGKAEREAFATGVAAQIPAGRFGKPSEIAAAAVFLASDEGAFTVGSEFIIDGGMATL